MQKKITNAIAKIDVSAEKKYALQMQFNDYISIVDDWQKNANLITVKDETDVESIQLAKEGLTFVKKKKTELEKLRKALKENSLREGQLIDLLARTFRESLEGIEEVLIPKADFIKIKEEKRKQELRKEREAIIEPYRDFFPQGYDLSTMEEKDFELALNGAKTVYQENLKILQAKKQKEEEEEKIKEIKMKFFQIGFTYNMEENSLQYVFNGKNEITLEIDKLIPNNEIELNRIIDDCKKEINSIQERHRNEVEKIRKENEELLHKQEVLRKENEEKSKALNEATAKIKSIEPPKYNFDVNSDYQKMMTLKHILENINFPVLEEKSYYYKINEQTKGLVNKITTWLNQSLTKKI